MEPKYLNYGYRLLDGYNTSSTDTKTFCTKYAGCFNSQNEIKYITDSDFSSWVKTTYNGPQLQHIDFSDSGSSDTPATFKNGTCYKIKNVNSGMYMQVEGGKAENSANVQQWGTADGTVHDIWKIVDAGSGYYYLISAVGDGGTYALDVTGKKADNGTNIEIYKYGGGTNQQFYITKNSDGSCIIKTRVSGNKSAVEIKDAGVQSGDNVQQWTLNGHACQNWIFENVDNPGCAMNTTHTYEFQNVNSKLLMEVTGGIMAENTNVQQWPSNKDKCQRWTLRDFGGNYFYIRSASDPNYALKAINGSNGGNICIVPFTLKDSALLFKFSKNPDGSYLILTRASREECYVEVASASTANGGNIQQWEPTNHTCQSWNVNVVDEVTLTLNAIKTRIYKDNDCVHTVVFVK